MLHDKRGFDFTVEHHYFSLTEMDELSEKVIPALKMDFAVFVVHAKESRLSTMAAVIPRYTELL